MQKSYIVHRNGEWRAAFATREAAEAYKVNAETEDEKLAEKWGFNPSEFGIHSTTQRAALHFLKARAA